MVSRLASTIRRWPGVAGVLLAVVALSGCDPVLVPEGPNQVEVSVGIDPHGAEMDVLAGRSDQELRRLGDTLGAALFPHAARTVRIDPNRPGHPYAVVKAHGVYQPGAAPTVSLEGGDLRRALLAAGLADASLSVCSPMVQVQVRTDPAGRVDVDDCATWQLTPASQDPEVSIALRPRPPPRLLTPALFVLAVGAAVAAGVILWRRRRRPSRRRLLLAVLALAVLLAAATVFWSPDSDDDLAVSGLATATELSARKAMEAFGFPLAVAAVVVLCIAVFDPGTGTRRSPTGPRW